VIGRGQHEQGKPPDEHDAAGTSDQRRPDRCAPLAEKTEKAAAMKKEPCLFSVLFQVALGGRHAGRHWQRAGVHLPFAFLYGLINPWRASPTVVYYLSAAALLLPGTYAAVVLLAAGRRQTGSA